MTAIKRIIGGKTYNTETSFQVCARTELDEDTDLEQHLFMTMEGRYFKISYRRPKGSAGCTPENLEKFETMTTEQARQWFSENGHASPESWFGKEDQDDSGQVMISVRLPKKIADDLMVHAIRSKRTRSNWINHAIISKLFEERQANV